MLEFIAESAPLCADNISWRICKEVLRGLDLIHSAQVLHHDIGQRNILVVSSTGRVVWIDFSSSYINPDDMEIWQERKVAYGLLYQEVVGRLHLCELIW
jgi:serine/threonine protein kinase